LTRHAVLEEDKRNAEEGILKLNALVDGVVAEDEYMLKLNASKEV
jgi:hypothetical protein